MDYIVFEVVSIVTWLLFLIGFYDRTFFLISAIIGFFFSTIAMNDGTFVLDQVFNPVTSTWVQYTISVYPSIVLMAAPVIASTLIFIVKTLPNPEGDILF